MARFAHSQGASFKRARQGIRAEISEVALGGQRAVLSLPQTFMNESGQAVVPIIRYYGIQPENILVVHDDIDVPFAKVKVQWARGHGGNNGVRSIAGSLKSEDFWRLKVGVGRPPGRVDPADFVLGKFRPVEREEISSAADKAGEIIERFISSGGDDARQFAGELNS